MTNVYLVYVLAFHLQSGKVSNWIAPRIMHYISFALHFICITFHLHLKIMPHQHEMHDTSRFKCHALHLHFMKWIAPRIMHYISFALHFICITFHLHLKNMPRQHKCMTCHDLNVMHYICIS